MFNALANGTVFLADVTTSGIDVGVVDDILEVTRTILGMFSVFPLNIFLTAGIITIGIGIFTSLKHS